MKEKIITLLILLTTINIHAQKWSKIGVAKENLNASFKNGIVSDNGLAVDESTGKLYALSKSDKMLYLNVFDKEWKILSQLDLKDREASGFFLKTDFKGTPYVLFNESKNGKSGLTLYKFENEKWIAVGEETFTGKMAYNPQLAFSNLNVPFVAYNDRFTNGGGKLSVKKYDGKIWQTVGTESFTNSSTYITLDVDKNENPYLGYLDWSTRSITVQKYENGVWKIINDPNISLGTVYPTIKIDRNNDTMYLLSDRNLKLFSYSALNGTKTWNSLTDDAVQQFMGEYPSLILNKDGLPLISFIGSDHNLTLLKPIGRSYEIVGQPGFSRLTGCGGSNPTLGYSLTYNIQENAPVVSFCCDCDLIPRRGFWTSVMSYK